LTSSSAPPEQETVLFDFDGTLISADSFGAFLLQFLRRRPARFLAFVAASPFVLPWLLAHRTRPRAFSILLWISTAGHHRDTWDAAMAEFAEQLASADRSVHTEGIDLVREHISAGDRVLIVTGCAEDLAQAICDRLGVGDVEIVGSRIARRWGGVVVLEHCIGRQKVKRLRTEYGLSTWKHVYTDHIVDLPLMKLAKGSTMVNPKRGHFEAARRMLGTKEPERVRWGQRQKKSRRRR
jgi:phosphatidylglycerophosphatase C